VVEVLFDLILLGMGPDAHTASLFPYTQALNETSRSAVENWVEKLNTWRFTLTYPAINSARNILFLVAGEDKAEALRRVLKGEFRPDEFPSQGVIPVDGDLQLFADEAAASLLDRSIV
jgi:6-phosphogluconolactonase